MKLNLFSKMSMQGKDLSIRRHRATARRTQMNPHDMHALMKHLIPRLYGHPGENPVVRVNTPSRVSLASYF